MYKITVYNEENRVSKYVYFSVDQSKMKQVYLDGLTTSKVKYKEEFFIQI